jgi:hypothetical protein
MSVYFITARDVGMVKIGCAYDPLSRLRDIQVCCPVELKIEAVMKGFYQEEREFHARFAEHRVRGEWFRITPDIESIMAELDHASRPYTGPSPSPRKKLERLKKEEACGDIHFPFRQLTEAES